METGNPSDRVREIRQKLIQWQVLYESAQRKRGAVAQFLREHGVPEDVADTLDKHQQRNEEQAYLRMRDLFRFELFMVTGEYGDFQRFANGLLQDSLPT